MHTVIALNWTTIQTPTLDIAQKFIEKMFFSTKKYDLGLFDIKMPKMDGNELLAKVRSSKKDELKEMPIIFLTS